MTTATKTKFHFKSRKDKDEAGNVIQVQEVDIKKDKDGNVVSTAAVTNKDGTPKMIDKVIPAPAPLELEIPLVTTEDLAAILQAPNNEKQVALILESMNAQILEQAREQVNDPDADVRTKGLDLTKLTFEFIANLPPSQRRGSAIPDEKWEAFSADYVDVMQHHGKDEAKAKTGAKLLVRKFQPVKMNKKVVSALKDNLQLWFTNSPNAEEFQDIYENLMGKADTILATDEDAILAAV